MSILGRVMLVWTSLGNQLPLNLLTEPHLQSSTVKVRIPEVSISETEKQRFLF